MESMFGLAWRPYAAALAAVLGLVLVLRAALVARNDARRPKKDALALALLVRGFRRAVLGLALIGVAAGWVWQQPWLLAVSLVVGFEETLESSIIVGALEAEHRETVRRAVDKHKA